MTDRLAYTRDQAAEACGVSEATIKRAIASGRLRAKRTAINDDGDPTGKYLILAADLTAWLEGLTAA